MRQNQQRMSESIESKNHGKSVSFRRKEPILLLAGFLLGVVTGVGLFLGLVHFAGIQTPMSTGLSETLERNFAKVKVGMTSGEAIKTIFNDVFIFPEHVDAKKSGLEKWPIWGYNAIKCIRARFEGSRPFTLTIDTKADRVIEAKYEYNTRFD